MNTYLHSSKLQTPLARQKLISRPHLLAKLDDGLTGEQGYTRKLTLFSAPAGSGKTTLAADWLRGHKHIHAWLSLDNGDNDPRRFLVYLLGALQRVEAGLGKSIEQALRSPRAFPPDELISLLLKEVTALTRPLILALDDYHEIQSPPVHAFINFLLEYQPASLHLVLITREDPPVPLARLRGRGQLLEIRQEDLRFNELECITFFQSTLGLDITAGAVATLIRRTEGWATGLHLAALALQGHPDPDVFIRSFSGSNRFILDYLLDEVLERQPLAVQDFLLKTSILERMCAPLCAALTSRADSQAQLNALEAANLFTIALDQTRSWYRYHRLFADLLRYRLSLAKDISITELHQTASRWFESNAYLSEAIEFALAGEDWQHAAQLIYQQQTELLKHGEIVTLLGWWRRLPKDMLENTPKLCAAYAWPLLLQGDNDLAGKLLEQAEAQAEPDTSEMGAICTAQAYLAQVRGDNAKMVSYSERALELLPLEDLDGRALVALNLGLAYWHMGKLTAAEQALRQALDAARQTKNDYITATEVVFLARSPAVRGRLRQAEQEFLEISTSHMAAPTLALVHLDLATIYYEWNDLPRSKEHIDHGLRIAKQTGVVEFQIAAYLLQARLHHAQGRRSQTLLSIQQAHECLSSGGVPLRSVERILALEFELGVADIQQAAHNDPGLYGVSTHPFYRFINLNPARALIACGQIAEARALLFGFGYQSQS